MKKVNYLLLLSLVMVVGCDTQGGSSPISTSSSTSSGDSSNTDSSISSNSSNSTSVEKTGTIAMYVVNDVHGSIEYSSENGDLGLSKLDYLIKHDSYYNSETSLILSAGDMFQGSGLSNLTYGLAMVDVMNNIGFDAMAIGNHEFDWGVDKLIAAKDQADFPFLAYDIFDKQSGETVDWVEPYVVLEKGPFKIGVIGEIGDLESSISYPVIKDYSLEPDMDYVNSKAQELKNDGCDLVVLLTHNGASNIYYELNSDYVDVIFGGHTHTVEDVTYNGIPYLQGGSNTRGMCKYVYSFDTNQTLVKSADYFSYYQLTNTTTSPTINSVITKYTDTLSSTLNEVVGNIDESFLRYFDGPTYNYGVFALVAKAMYDYGSRILNNEEIIVVHNTGGIRGNLEKSNNDTWSPVTYGEIYTILPFDNEVNVIEATGANLKRALRGSNTYYPFNLNVDNLQDTQMYSVVTISYLCDDPSKPLYDSTPQLLNGTAGLYVRDIVSNYFRTNENVSLSDFPTYSY